MRPKSFLDCEEKVGVKAGGVTQLVGCEQSKHRHYYTHQIWWDTPVIPAFMNRRWEDQNQPVIHKILSRSSVNQPTNQWKGWWSWRPKQEEGVETEAGEVSEGHPGYCSCFNPL